MNTDFESQVTAALQEKANTVPLSAELDVAWKSLRSHERNRKHRTSVVSLVAAVAILSGGVGVWRAQRNRNDTQQFATQDVSEFRLIPSFFPETSTVTRIAFDSYGPPRTSRVRQWAAGKSSIILRESVRVPKQTNNIGATDDLACGCISWSDAQTDFAIGYSSGAGHDLAKEVANSVGRIASSPWSVIRAPSNLPLVVDEISNGQDDGSWGLSLTTWPRGAMLYAQPASNAIALKNGVDASRADGELTVVRKQKARVVKQSGSAQVLWEEGGYLIGLNGPDWKELLGLAESLRPASITEFNDLTHADSGNSINSLVPNRVVVHAEESQIATVQIADTATSTGCVNVQINEEGKSLCVPLSNKPVLCPRCEPLVAGRDSCS
jgi:hypothetical protein